MVQHTITVIVQWRPWSLVGSSSHDSRSCGFKEKHQILQDTQQKLETSFFCLFARDTAAIQTQSLDLEFWDKLIPTEKCNWYILCTKCSWTRFSADVNPHSSTVVNGAAPVHTGRGPGLVFIIYQWLTLKAKVCAPFHKKVSTCIFCCCILRL